MRLFLSSYHFGKYPEKLAELTGENKRVAVIANAQDSKPDEARKKRVQKELGDLIKLGFDPFEIDLRDYFDKEIAEEDIAYCGLIWVRGGNVFNLRRAFKYSGFDKLVAKGLQEDKFVYGGYSAGVCVLQPTLHGIELCDPTDDIPSGYDSEVIWVGLNLIPYSVAPHYRSPHYESGLIDRVVEYYEANGLPYKTMRDGDVFVVNGNKNEELLR